MRRAVRLPLSGPPSAPPNNNCVDSFRSLFHICSNANMIGFEETARCIRGGTVE
jgi:hypothetical protein